MAETTRDDEPRNANGVTLREGLEAWEKHERSEGAICNANLLRWALDEIASLRTQTALRSLDLSKPVEG